ncbi:hypothetical protein ACO2Q8_26265 [Larkinella sp. VNQ87]|uniref:hypothetical protein n=1 Tax=Larkinella sp. VNQ87 TaxID=3400921 RepID=UPI003C0F14B9
METTIAPLSPETLLLDYTQWLDFVMASRRTIRRYDYQLGQLGKRYTDLSDLSNYLRRCMHQRSLFLGGLILQLTGKVAQLRAEPTNPELIRHLAGAHSTIQALITYLKTVLTELEESYRTLLPGQPTIRTTTLF